MKIVRYFVAVVLTLLVDRVVCMRNIALIYQSQVNALHCASMAMRNGLGDGAALFVRADIYADTNALYDTSPEVMDERNLSYLKKAIGKGNSEALRLGGIISLDLSRYRPSAIIEILRNAKPSMSVLGYPSMVFDDFSLLVDKCVMSLFSKNANKTFIAFAYKWLREATDAGNQRAYKNLKFHFLDHNYFGCRDELAEHYRLGLIRDF
jgi:hypothetical protein